MKLYRAKTLYKQLAIIKEFTSCLGTKCSTLIGAVSYTYITEMQLDFRPANEVEDSKMYCLSSLTSHVQNGCER